MGSRGSVNLTAEYSTLVFCKSPRNMKAHASWWFTMGICVIIEFQGVKPRVVSDRSVAVLYS